MDERETGAAGSDARFQRDNERGIGELVKSLSQETSTLVRQEMQLAKAEVSQSAKQAGIGAGMFGGAGLVGLFAFGALTAAIIALLGTAMATWVAALIVTVVYAAIAGVLAITGKNRVQEATPPVEQTKESVQADVATVKEAAGR